MAQRIQYIKISRIDENGTDQSSTLQNLTQITIPWSGSSSSSITFEINNITAYPTYFLYSIKPNNTFSNSTITNNSASIEYDFSSSIQLTPQDKLYSALFTVKQQSIPLINPVVDNLDFYIPSSSNGFLFHETGVNPDGAYYQLNTYPQKNLEINFSGSIFLDINYPGLELNNSVTVGIAIRRFNAPGLVPTSITKQFNISAFPLTSSFTGSFHLSMSYGSTPFSDIEALPGDKVFPYIQFNPINCSQTASFSNDSYFLITSSIASGPTLNSIPEPYFTVDYSNAFNCQPLYGNALENQTSYKWQQVDYGDGIFTPTNFNLIISGSALKAQVQDSNYSSLRHIIPRYLGSKNQTEFINEWTDSENNIGTYGKTPSIESTNTIVGYANWVGGWPPEKSNASTVKIKNLINEDGELTSPDVSKNYLENIQNTFRSGEEIIISPLNEENNGGEFIRKVIRGGQRIEPYLTNQSKYPERDGFAEFVDTLEFKEINPAGVIITQNYTALLDANGNLSGNGIGPDNWVDAPKLNNVSTGSDITTEVSSPLLEYEISSNLLGTNVQSLTFDYNAVIQNNNNFSSTFYAKLILERGSNITELALKPANSTYETYSNGVVPQNSTRPLQFRHTIQLSQFQPGDKIKIQYNRGHGQIFPQTQNSLLQISQSPTPTPPITVSGSGVGLFDYTPFSTVIRVNPEFVSNYYNNQTLQKSISGSGYNEISLPVEFKPGDEVRFEGDKVYSIIGSGVSNITNNLFIVLNQPVTGSNFSVDINQFSFTRYIDDPTSVIIEGFRPPNSQGPYIVKPKYITDKLDSNLDVYLTDFINKGVL